MNHCVLGFETFWDKAHMTVDQYFPEMQKRIQLTSCYKHDVDFPCGGYGSHPEPVWPTKPPSRFDFGTSTVVAPEQL